MISHLVLTPAVRDDLFAHARTGTATEESGDRPAGEEVCGVLAGNRREDDAEELDADIEGPAAETAVVTACRRVPNVAAQPTHRYELDPAATVGAIEALEADGLEHVGFYHSHPRGPRGPSATDQAQATWPGYVYLIVSLGAEPSDTDSAAEPVIGAWRWSGESFVQLPIDVEGTGDD